MKDSPEEVTAAQAASLTGLSERTIRRWIAAGDIPARHVARNRYAIRVHDLPVRRAPDDLTIRVEALEYRVRLLELQTARLATPEPPECTAAGEGGEGGEEAGPPGKLHELLCQLAHETQRLAPLLTALAAQPPPRSLRSAESEEAEEAETGSDAARTG